MTTKEQLEIIAAFADGKGMERRNIWLHDIPSNWKSVQDSDHSFNFQDYNYRIKPEPPSEEELIKKAWVEWDYDWPHKLSEYHMLASFQAGWDAAKQHFTKHTP